MHTFQVNFSIQFLTSTCFEPHEFILAPMHVKHTIQTLCIQVFLRMNPWGLKHVYVKNWMKSVHFVGLCCITIIFIWLLFLKLLKWLISFSFIIWLRLSDMKLCC